MNHLSDFGSLGGVQTYLCALAKHKLNKIQLFSFTKPLEIYILKDSKKLKINKLGFKYIKDLLLGINIIHNLILSKKWIPFILFHKLLRKKVVYHEHGIAWHDPDKNYSLYKRRIKDVDIIIVNSFATKQLLINKYKIKKNINILRSPINLFEDNNKIIENDLSQKYNLISLRSKEITIGFLGRLEKHKNPIYLIKVANYLRDKFDILVKLEFIGSGPELNALKTFSDKSRINSKFYGLVKNRRSIVKKWHFGIVPSVREPLGLVQGEMALMNTLCFASNIDGIPELYPDECDYLKIKMLKRKKASSENINYQYSPSLKTFDKGYEPEIKDCSKKIAFLIESPEKLKQLILDHQLFIKRNFSIENHFYSLKQIIYN